MSHQNRLPGGGYGYPSGTYARNGLEFSDVIDIINVVDEHVFNGGDGSPEQPPPPWGAGRDHYYNNPAVACSNQPPVSEALAVVGRMTWTEKTELARLLKAANGGFGPSVSELGNQWLVPWWLKAVYGGVDCRATSTQGQQLLAYWEAMMDRYPAGYPSTTGGQPDAPTIPGTNIPLPDVDIKWPPTDAPSGPGPSAPPYGAPYPAPGPIGGPGATGLLLAAGLGILLLATPKRR